MYFWHLRIRRQALVQESHNAPFKRSSGDDWRATPPQKHYDAARPQERFTFYTRSGDFRLTLWIQCLFFHCQKHQKCAWTHRGLCRKLYKYKINSKHISYLNSKQPPSLKSSVTECVFLCSILTYISLIYLMSSVSISRVGRSKDKTEMHEKVCQTFDRECILTS